MNSQPENNTQQQHDSREMKRLENLRDNALTLADFHRDEAHKQAIQNCSEAMLLATRQFLYEVEMARRTFELNSGVFVAIDDEKNTAVAQ